MLHFLIFLKLLSFKIDFTIKLTHTPNQQSHSMDHNSNQYQYHTSYDNRGSYGPVEGDRDEINYRGHQMEMAHETRRGKYSKFKIWVI